MQTYSVPVTQLRANLSHYLREVQQGQAITITDRSQPIVKLEPVSRPKVQKPSNTKWLQQMIASAPIPPKHTPKDLASNLDKYLYGI